MEDLGEVPSDAFERWMTDELEANYDEVFVYFSSGDAEIFDKVCQLEIFVPGDHAEAGVDDKGAFLEVLDKFSNFGLITSSLDQDGPEEAVYEISPKALKLQYFLASQAAD